MSSSHNFNDNSEPEQAITRQSATSSEAQQRNLPHLLERVPSGIAGLDTILNGGFMRGGIYYISGQPGTGKTILSNQMAFSHVASGGRVVFASILSETHARMLAHLSELSFFDPTHIGDSIYYISGYTILEKNGLKGLLDQLWRAIRDNKATLLIIDGSLNAQTFARSDLAFKQFIQLLQTYADTYRCTVLLLNSIDHGEDLNEIVTGQTTVDGIIRLSNNMVGLRSARALQVRKFRGSGFLEGTHHMLITADGVQVYPRIEAVVSQQAHIHRSVKASRERLGFGSTKLDDMLGGGVFVGSSTILLGPPGSGKTLLSLTYLAEGARQGQPGLYFGLNEPPAHIIDAGDHIGLDISSLVEQKLIHIAWQPAVEESLDVIAYNLLALIREHGVVRLVIDGLDAIDDINLQPQRTALFYAALMGELRTLGVASISTSELTAFFGPTVDIPIEGVSARVENVIFMRTVEIRSGLQRIISVLKTRRTAHDTAIREFRITDKGLEIGDKFAAAEGIITGVARPLQSHRE